MELSTYFEALIDADKEGVAVFMAGGVGAGKSTFAELIFGEGFKGFVSVRPDALLERAEQMNKADFDKDKRRDVVARSKKSGMANFTKRSKASYNIILDRTGRAVQETKAEIERLKKLGYTKIYMVFIYTDDVELSKRRNATRRRKEPEATVIDYHNYAIKNKPLYQEIFGENFLAINNKKPITDFHLLYGISRQVRDAIVSGDTIAPFESRFNEKLND